MASPRLIRTLFGTATLSAITIFVLASHVVTAQPVYPMGQTSFGTNLHENLVDESDSLALVALFEATNGPGWKANWQWLTGPVREWTGVKVREGRVTALDLRINGLDGQIPPELGNLSGLTNLNLYGNRLSGPIPAELGMLQSVDTLDLGVNKLTGAIPPELGNLPNLGVLRLGFNQLTGPIQPELGNLEGLRWLVLQSNQLTGPIPPELGNLKSLEVLHLLHNQITGPIPPELGNLENLTEILLMSNQLSGSIPAELGGLQNLEALWLDSNQLTGPIPPELGNLDSLRSLLVGWNALSGSIPPELGNLQSLRSLLLRDNQLTGPIPPELGNLQNLEQLQLSANQLTGPIPPELVSIQHLTYLWLQDNLLEGTLPPSVAEWAALVWRCDFRDNLPSLCIPDTPEYREIGKEPICGLWLSEECEVLAANDEDQPNAPRSVAFESVYPSPFSGGLALRFGLPSGGHIRIDVYDVSGRLVATPVDAPFGPGTHEATWETGSGKAGALPAGIYLLRMISGSETRSTVVVKVE